MSPGAPDCPTEEEIFLYMAGQLAGDEQDTVRAHVVACASCRDVVVLEAKQEPGAAPQELLAGKYAIERELGAGGMGRVLAARHVKLGKDVAIKMIHAEYVREPKVVDRFTREARAAAALKSRHAVQVFDIDVSETGEPFIVMERLSGMDLGSKVAREGPLAVEEALRYVLQACDALAEAHEAGIIHRDIKPANLFLAEVGSGEHIVKVLDFGLAKAIPGGAFVGTEHTSLTAKSDLLGSPRYMSPEQFAGEVDHRTDIWSIGVTLYFLLSGEPPFEAEDLGGLRHQITTEEAVPLGSRRNDLPASVVAAVARCLVVNRDQRWSSVRAFATALERAYAEVASQPADPRRSSLARPLPFDVGRYTVVRLIASGGMGSVYLARARGALGFSRPVALKHLHAHLAHEEDTRRRFLAEARLVSHIDHPHVVKVLDVVEEDGEVFLVLEYVHGETLQHLLRAAADRSAPIPLGVISSIFCQIAEALHAAHEALGDNGAPLGIVHRDVSPHNVLVAKQGAAYVTDFGIAKVKAHLAETKSGVLGKTSYMAPEQLRGETVTRAADVFALGVMLWEALTRKRLFGGLEDRLSRESSSAAPIKAPSTFDANVAPELDALVMATLAREPADRPRTALEVAHALRRVAPPANGEIVGAWVSSLASGRLAALDGAAVSPPRGTVVQVTPDRPSGHTDTVAQTMSSVAGGPSGPSPAGHHHAEPARSKRPIALVAALAMLVAIAVPLAVGAVRSRSRAASRADEPRVLATTSPLNDPVHAIPAGSPVPPASVAGEPLEAPTTSAPPVRLAAAPDPFRRGGATNGRPTRPRAPDSLPSSTPISTSKPPAPTDDPFPSIRK